MVDWSGVGAALGSAMAAFLAHRAHRSAQRTEDTAARNNEAIQQALRLETYIHTRMHDVRNDLYRISLGVVEILRRHGLDLPDPREPEPYVPPKEDDGAQ